MSWSASLQSNFPDPWFACMFFNSCMFQTIKFHGVVIWATLTIQVLRKVQKTYSQENPQSRILKKTLRFARLGTHRRDRNRVLSSNWFVKNVWGCTLSEPYYERKTGGRSVYWTDPRLRIPPTVQHQICDNHETATTTSWCGKPVRGGIEAMEAILLMKAPIVLNNCRD